MVSQYLDQKGISYESINPFDQPEIALKYRIRSVPTVILLEKEEEIKRVIGFKPEELSLLTAI
jgi:thioredoxin 1